MSHCPTTRRYPRLPAVAAANQRRPVGGDAGGHAGGHAGGRPGGRAGWAALGLVLALAGCGGGGGGDGSGSAAPGQASASAAPALSAVASLGELAFHDPSLSASGRQACSSCHDPAHGHASPNSLPAQSGGATLALQGGRNVPSIRYLASNTAFRFAADGTPNGGFFWDGRAASLQAQAGEPLLNPREMANTSQAEVVQRLALAPYAAQFKTLFGQDIFSQPALAFARLTLALQQYQREDPDFQPFSSQYDAFLRGQTTLSLSQLRGLALFNAADKGNCAACHPSARGADGSLPLFTDFSYDNLGVPRNTALAQNADQAHFDLGLCSRSDAGLAQRTDLCGAFKVPSLRNVALRGALFHNGRFGTLKEALTFYVQRDTQPEKWYPLRADGTVDKFNDLPALWRNNVNTSEVPYNRSAGAQPALTDAEINDLIAFLGTLTDGFVP